MLLIIIIIIIVIIVIVIVIIIDNECRHMTLLSRSTATFTHGS